jgi:hypothetical protein
MRQTPARAGPAERVGSTSMSNPKVKFGQDGAFGNMPIVNQCRNRPKFTKLEQMCKVTRWFGDPHLNQYAGPNVRPQETFLSPRHFVRPFPQRHGPASDPICPFSRDIWAKFCPSGPETSTPVIRGPMQRPCSVSPPVHPQRSRPPVRSGTVRNRVQPTKTTTRAFSSELDGAIVRHPLITHEALLRRARQRVHARLAGHVRARLHHCCVSSAVQAPRNRRIHAR